MADITMCTGEGCPLRENCYRANATANEWRQSYFTTPPFKGEKCDFFWSTKRRDIKGAEA